jgi:hypothetical protein
MLNDQTSSDCAGAREEIDQKILVDDIKDMLIIIVHEV